MINHIHVARTDLPRSEEILTHEALAFVGDLYAKFHKKHRELLGARLIAQQNYDAGMLPDFLPETEQIRTGSWKIWPVSKDIQDRRVEITGPASSRKMVVNALNSGAKVYMADAEDSESPTLANLLNGQLNMYDVSRDQIDFKDAKTGKEYTLKGKTAELFFRPRGLHLLEPHLKVNGVPVPASFFDFGLYAFHNAKELGYRGRGVYFYLPKMESATEAKLWNEIFNYAEERLGLFQGEIKATALIETLPAVFQMHEILYELRSHSAGLNCGRWDYIFSYIKKLRKHPQFVLPDRGQLTMDKGFLAAYVKLLIQTCHRRGAHAMGGMAAQIPVKGDSEEARRINAEQTEKVEADKEREAKLGHDGTWVAHPDQVPVAEKPFNRYMPGPNQIETATPSDVTVTREELLAPIEGTITEEGVKKNVRQVAYWCSWLKGIGAAALWHLMEDVATGEISRSQIRQWLEHGVKLDDGRVVNEAMLDNIMAAVRHEAEAESWFSPEYEEAADLFMALAKAREWEEFMTIPAYELLLKKERAAT